MSLSDASDFLSSAGGLWPFIALAALIVLLPSIRRLLNDRSVKIKIGEFELSAQDAANEIQKTLLDLQQKVGELRTDLDGLRISDSYNHPARASLHAPPVAEQRTTAALDSNDTTSSKHVLWVD